MSMTFSRVVSTATAAYAGYCFVEPSHLPKGLGWGPDHTQTGERIAYVLGVRDAAISAVGIFGDEHQVRRAMQTRMFFDVFDASVLAPQAASGKDKAKVAAVALTWGAVNLAALTADSRRVRKASSLALLVANPASIPRALL